MPDDVRSTVLTRNKATNYGVVRLNLLERLFDDQYMQKLRNPDVSTWPHRIHPYTEIVSTKPKGDRILVKARNILNGEEWEEEFDAVVVATGYVRNIHKEILKGCEGVFQKKPNGEIDWTTERAYKCKLREDRVAKDAGIWLQGCNEATHGVSDSHISFLNSTNAFIALRHSPLHPLRPRRRSRLRHVRQGRACKGSYRRDPRLEGAVLEAQVKTYQPGCQGGVGQEGEGWLHHLLSLSFGVWKHFGFSIKGIG